MSASFTAPGPQQRRFAAYFDSLARAAGHRVRAVPLESYCTGLLLPGERKSVEPMAARLAVPTKNSVHIEIVAFTESRPVAFPSHVESALFSARLFPHSRRSTS